MAVAAASFLLATRTSTSVTGGVGAPGLAGVPFPSSSADPNATWTFTDNFNGASGSRPSSATWGYDLGGGGWGNGELQTYTNKAANVGLDGKGHLKITARRSGNTYTSARLTTRGKMTYKYGTLQARVSLPRGQGLLPAYWMLGSDLPTVGYPQCGEIDTVEAPNTRDTFFTVHGPTTTGSNWSISTRSRGETAGYHVYTVIRAYNSITIDVDSRTVLHLVPGDLVQGQQWVFNKPFDVLLDVAVGGVFAGAPDSTTPFPATMSVDYVRYHP